MIEKLEEFFTFKNKMPEKGKKLIVSNNPSGRNAFGEMSHVWFVDGVTDSGTELDGITAETEFGRAVNLTHWKYDKGE